MCRTWRICERKIKKAWFETAKIRYEDYNKTMINIAVKAGKVGKVDTSIVNVVYKNKNVLTIYICA